MMWTSSPFACSWAFSHLPSPCPPTFPPVQCAQCQAQRPLPSPCDHWSHPVVMGRYRNRRNGISALEVLQIQVRRETSRKDPQQLHVSINQAKRDGRRSQQSEEGTQWARSIRMQWARSIRGGFPGRQSLNWLLWRGPGLIERRVQRPPACSALCQGGCRQSQHLAGQPLPPLATPSSSLCTFSQTSSPLPGASTCSVSGCLCPLGPQALPFPCCPSASPSIEIRVGNRKTAISSGTAKVPRNP